MDKCESCGDSMFYGVRVIGSLECCDGMYCNECWEKMKVVKEKYTIYAIEYKDRYDNEYTVGVSAESEYGAIKRLCGNRCAFVLAVEETNKKPEYDERRVEGFMDYDFKEEAYMWEYK